MSCREEQNFAGWIIDSLKFAASGECVSGRLALSGLPRLADVLVDSAGWLDCRLSGFTGEGELAGKKGLHLQVSGRLVLCCQRCLGPVNVACVIDTRLLLIPEGAEWPEDELESDSYDAIPAEHEMRVADRIEEEVLLALPIVPRHADCDLPTDSRPAVEEKTVSPFAVLAGLKKQCH